MRIHRIRGMGGNMSLVLAKILGTGFATGIICYLVIKFSEKEKK